MFELVSAGLHLDPANIFEPTPKMEYYPMDRVRISTILYGTSVGTSTNAGSATTSETYTQFHRSHRHISDDEFLRWAQEQFRHWQSKQEYSHHRQSKQKRRARAALGVVEPWQVVMGLAPDASKREIVARYRALAKEHHPDAGGSADEFIRIHKAYLAGTKGRG